MTRPVTVVPIRNQGADGYRAHLFHGAGGNVLNLAMLARCWPDTRPLYGIQAAGLDGTIPPDPSIVAMAERYTTDLVATGSNGPWLFAGYSGGGIVALEVATRLVDLGHRVGPVVLIDTPHPDVDKQNTVQQLLTVGRNIPALSRSDLARMTTGVRRRLFNPGEVDADSIEDTTSLEEFGFVDLKPHFFAITDAVPRRVYPLDVVVVRAEVFFTRRPLDLGWQRFVSRRLRVRTSPGNHVTMLARENAPALAKVIASVFDEWEIYNAPRSPSTQSRN